MPLIATRGAASAQGFGEFAQTTAPVYIEDVFSTWLYTGNGSTQTITNGIDLSGKGGLVWIKNRSTPTNTGDHRLYDTLRGVNNALFSNTVDSQTTLNSSLTAFNSTGFSLGTNARVNESNVTWASWTFRKAEKFFDVVTYTGNGTAGRTVSHNLGSTPGCIIVKSTSSTAWYVYHRSLGATKILTLDTIDPEITNSNYWNNTEPTSTVFTLGAASPVNGNGNTYVAYLFAHNAGGFGDAGSDNVISCGSFTTDGSGNATVNLGYEPQWVMIKASSTTSNWFTIDNMRGFSQSQYAYLFPNTFGAESSSTTTTGVIPTATGFTVGINFSALNTTYIYIAIRRGPMKTPTSGTSVFTPVSNTSPTTGNLTDLTINRQPTGLQSTWAISRLTNAGLETQSTNAETSTSAFVKFDVMTGVTNSGWLTNSNSIWWNFRRAPGFFDVVCYTGTGSARTVSHNLGVVPELMIVKRRNSSTYGDWYVYAASQGATKFLLLNLTDAVATNSGPWNNTAPTSSVFTAGSDLSINSTATYVAYLFASVSGVSKVGTYTGTGALQTVNCGFTGGARFVLIKRTDSTGDWWVYDSARGITSGNDPYLFLNSTAAEVTNTNYVDTTSVGFQVTAAAPAGLNANGGTFIFLAVA